MFQASTFSQYRLLFEGPRLTSLAAAEPPCNELKTSQQQSCSSQRWLLPSAGGLRPAAIGREVNFRSGCSQATRPIRFRSLAWQFFCRVGRALGLSDTTHAVQSKYTWRCPPARLRPAGLVGGMHSKRAQWRLADTRRYPGCLVVTTRSPAFVAPCLSVAVLLEAHVHSTLSRRRTVQCIPVVQLFVGTIRWAVVVQLDKPKP